MKKWGVVLLFSIVLVSLSVSPVFGQAIITNGSGVYLGVNTFGHLNAPNGSGGVTAPPVPDHTNDPVGVFLAGQGDSTSPGCLCEGWGVGVTVGVTQHVGYASIANGGISNLVLDSFTNPNSGSATSVVHLTSLPTLSVSQVYSIASANLFQDVVTITNNGATAITALRYERVMDWDVPPTEFDEFVTIQGWPASALFHTSDDGFHVPDPYVLSTSICAGAPDNANFTDAGICDHGADFVFDFGSLAAGASKTFTIFYGAATSEAGALSALGAVGAEVYSLGQSSTTGGPTSGTPATFIFGFAGVGGTPVPPPTSTPEPTSLVLLGAGLTGLAVLRRKYKGQ